MRSLVVLLVLTFLPGFIVEAKTPQKFEGRLLSHYQLLQLPAKKRVQYVRELSQVLAVLEKAQRKYETESSRAEIQRLKDYIANLLPTLALLPEAQADELARVALVPRWTGKGWQCVGDNVAFDPQLGTCAYQKKALIGKTFWFLPPTTPGETSCPAEDATAVFTTPKGARKCVPRESWEALSEQRRVDIASGVNLGDRYFKLNDSDPKRTMHMVHGAGLYKPDGTPTSAPSSGPSTGDTPTAGGEPAAPPADGQPGATTPTDGAGAAACEKPTFTCRDLEPAARDQLISAFRKNGDNVCVAGGFFSEYRNGKKKPLNCEWKSEFRFSGAKNPFKCQDKKLRNGKVEKQALCNPAVFCLGLKTDENLAKLVRTDKSVANMFSRTGDPVESMNNIATATLDNNGEGMIQTFLCAKLGQDLTKQCSQAFQSHLDGRLGLGDKNRGEKYTACDAMNLKYPISNLKRADGETEEDFNKRQAARDGVMKDRQKDWDQLVSGVLERYKTMCSNAQQEFTALFCDECQEIANRIYAMNEKAIGAPCAGGAGAGEAQPPAADPTRAVQ